MRVTRQILSCVVLLLYLYNLAGYVGVFLILRESIREEMAGELRGEIPAESLVTLTFHTRSMEEGGCRVRWLEEHEFRYNGKMYDVVSRVVRGDSTEFTCLVDAKEERLYASLEEHVTSQTDQSSPHGSLNSIKSVLQEFLPLQSQVEIVSFTEVSHPIIPADGYQSVVPDILTPPPRLLQIG